MNPETENEFANMTEEAFETFLTDAIEGFADENEAPLRSIATFAENGLLTMNKGLVLRVGKAEFQITIVRSR